MEQMRPVNNSSPERHGVRGNILIYVYFHAYMSILGVNKFVCIVWLLQKDSMRGAAPLPYVPLLRTNERQVKCFGLLLGVQ